MLANAKSNANLMRLLLALDPLISVDPRIKALGLCHFGKRDWETKITRGPSFAHDKKQTERI